MVWGGGGRGLGLHRVGSAEGRDCYDVCKCQPVLTPHCVLPAAANSLLATHCLLLPTA